jgi:Double zinc ribbon
VVEFWIVILALAVVLLLVVVFVTITLLSRYRLRRVAELRSEATTPRAQSDRAYNRLALARREADLLAAQGVEVASAQQLIDLANRSLDARDFGRAYDLAQAAHETLVKARRDPLRSGSKGTSPPPGPAATPLPTTASPPAAGAPAAGPPTPSIPKSRVEAQFELRMFEQDLVQAKQRGASGPDVDGAREMYVQAHAAFSKGAYPEAFRLSLRGRRRIGGSVESLGPPGPATPAAAPATAEGDPVRAAEEVAAAGRCAQCGHPTVVGDTFCRGCGAALAPPTCPSCGAPRTPRDTFCGKCGARFD